LHKQNAGDYGSCPSIAANVSEELAEMYETQFYGCMYITNMEKRAFSQ
jgi:hypothetical protein